MDAHSVDLSRATYAVLSVSRLLCQENSAQLIMLCAYSTHGDCSRGL